MRSPWRAVTLFGTPRIERDGAAVTVERRKSLALLAYLAVTRQPHGRDALATLLWPDSDAERARAGLRRTLVDLNQALGKGWVEVETGRKMKYASSIPYGIIRVRHKAA